MTRAACFSPNSVEKDRAIMEAVVARLQAGGHETEMVDEDLLTEALCPLFATRRPQMVVTMGRRPETLQRLREAELAGVTVVNSPQGVERCSRRKLAAVMRECDIPMPPTEGSAGYWLKRGDAAAQGRDDVVFAADKRQLVLQMAAFRRRGIDSYTVEAHVVGDVVKFYGVRGTGFFRYYYPTDDGDQKFGDEARNGAARHYAFPADHLQRAAERLATAVGVDIYGGDCIVRADGSFCMIDFNDWPSFARCRDEAAEAIVGLVTKELEKKWEDSGSCCRLR